jgi:transposase
MRKGFNTLTGIVTNVSGQGLLDGSVYVFVNRARTTVKILHRECGGFVIYHKQLECGRISKLIFKHEEAFRSIRWDEPELLMEGINPNTKRRKRYPE